MGLLGTMAGAIKTNLDALDAGNQSAWSAQNTARTEDQQYIISADMAEFAALKEGYKAKRDARMESLTTERADTLAEISAIVGVDTDSSGAGTIFAIISELGDQYSDWNSVLTAANAAYDAKEAQYKTDLGVASEFTSAYTAQ